MLSGSEITHQRDLGNITITPWDDSRVGCNSYNLRLAPDMLVYRDNWVSREYRHGYEPRLFLDSSRDNPTVPLTIPVGGMVLEPGILYLGSTMEHTHTRGFVPCISGRSSVGRLGLTVHVTAGFGDAGFAGDWTLEMTVVCPLRVFAGSEICQIYYFPVEGEVREYAGKYRGQAGPKASGWWRDFQ